MESSGGRLRVMTYNIKDGGEDYPDELANILRDEQPDLVMLQEANDETVFYNLGRGLGFQAVLGEGNRGFHVGVLSRYPVTRWANHPDQGVFHHTALEAHLETPFGPLAVLTAHFRPGYSSSDEEWRIKEIERVLEYMRPYQESLSLLAGDFNTMSPADKLILEDWPVQWRGPLLAQGGNLPREAVGRVLERGYLDAYRKLYPDPVRNPGYTLPAARPNIRLDYIFTSLALAAHLHAIQVVTHPDALNSSDHLPVEADFEF